MRTWTIVVAGFLAMLGCFPTSATIATHRYQVIGCVISGQFVPYAKQRQAAVKLPYWVRRSGGSKLEGKEIRLMWSARVTAGEIPNYVFARNDARWELVGACDRSRLPATGR